jgi:glycosyltransferase involved in cell wall biosynthesis
VKMAKANMEESSVGEETERRYHGAASFIVYSDDFGVHPSSCQHLFKHISKSHPVVWVNTIGMRNPSLRLNDLRKAYQKITRMVIRRATQSLEIANNRMVICQPPMLPYTGLRWVRRLNRSMVVKRVQRSLGEVKCIDPFIVITAPNAYDLTGLGEQAMIYYCVDDFSMWPGLKKRVIEKMEAGLVAKADAFVATSEKLYMKLVRYGKPTYLLTHGVDLELFSSEPKAEHGCLREIPRPRIGYFGLFDERSDQTLIAKVASRLPKYSFVITGPATVQASIMREQANIFFTGPVLYEELPAVIKGFDVLFLPYRVNSLSETISPLKLKEYLASGKQVVSSKIPEVNAFKDYVVTASSTDEWESAIRGAEAISKLGQGKKPRDILASETWEKKADAFLRICEGLRKAPS